jgi:hypothetical protein
VKNLSTNLLLFVLAIGVWTLALGRLMIPEAAAKQATADQSIAMVSLPNANSIVIARAGAIQVWRVRSTADGKTALEMAAIRSLP